MISFSNIPGRKVAFNMAHQPKSSGKKNDSATKNKSILKATPLKDHNHMQQQQQANRVKASLFGTPSKKRGELCSPVKVNQIAIRRTPRRVTPGETATPVRELP